MQITRQRQRFSSRVVKFASQVLYSMWVHQELREVYRKAGWKEQDFVTKTIAARNARPNSPTNMNSTLNRPMASQGGTRYEDRTMRAAHAAQGGGHGHAQGTIQAHMANNSVHGYRVSERISHIIKGNVPTVTDYVWTKNNILLFSPRMFPWETCPFTDEPGIQRPRPESCTRRGRTIT